MIKTDYEKLRRDQLGGEEKGKKLLLHSCCAPCSSGVLDRLVDFFEITIFFYNPNMDTKEEFDKRANEQIRFIKEYCGEKIKVVIAKYDNDKYLQIVKGTEDISEGGARCERCFKMRFDACVEYADANGFDYFTTTLTVSPYKNAPLINSIGERACENAKVKWLYCDFKKDDGYLHSIENSKKYGLYRQDYCGCIFSLKEAEKRKKVSL